MAHALRVAQAATCAGLITLTACGGGGGGGIGSIPAPIATATPAPGPSPTASPTAPPTGDGNDTGEYRATVGAVSTIRTGTASRSPLPSPGGATLGAGALGANLFWRRQPGNIADAPADRGGVVRYSLTF